MVMVVGGFVVVKGELALGVDNARSEIPLCAKRFNSVVGLGEALVPPVKIKWVRVHMWGLWLWLEKMAERRQPICSSHNVDRGRYKGTSLHGPTKNL